MSKPSSADRYLSILLQGAGKSLSVRVLGLGLVFVANIAMARFVPLHDYGTYVFVTNLTAIAALAVQFGLGDAAVRLVPNFLAANDVAMVGRYIRFALSVILVCTLALALGYGFYYAISSSEVGVSCGAFLLGFALLPCVAAVQFLQQIARSARWITLSQVFEQVALPLGMLMACAILPWFVPRVTYVDLLTVHVCLYALAACWLWNRTSRLSAGAPCAFSFYPLAEGGRWLAVALALGVANFAVLFFGRADILFVGLMKGDAAVATYSAASRTAGFVIFGLYAMDAIAAPLLSQQYSVRSRQATAAILTLASGLATLLAMGLAFGLWAFGPVVLGLFGKEFVGSQRLLTVLALARVVQAMFGLTGTLLWAAGHQVCYMIISVTTAIVAAIAFPMGILWGGEMGAAVANVVMTLAYSGAFALATWRLTGVAFSLSALRNYLRTTDHDLRERARETAVETRVDFCYESHRHPICARHAGVGFREKELVRESHENSF